MIADTGPTASVNMVPRKGLRRTAARTRMMHDELLYAAQRSCYVLPRTAVCEFVSDIDNPHPLTFRPFRAFAQTAQVPRYCAAQPCPDLRAPVRRPSRTARRFLSTRAALR